MRRIKSSLCRVYIEPAGGAVRLSHIRRRFFVSSEANIEKLSYNCSGVSGLASIREKRCTCSVGNSGARLES